MSDLGAVLDVSSWADLDTWRDLGPRVGAATAVAVAGGLLARRAGATALAVAVAAAALALTLVSVSLPEGPRALASHLLIVVALLLTVRPRTAPAEAALGLVVALAAAGLAPGAWLLVPAVPAAALAGGDARQRRFVGSALLAVAVPAAGVAALLWWTQRWSPPWPPADITGVVSVLALPGLVAILAASVAAGLSAVVRAAQRRRGDPSPLPTGRPVGVLATVLVVALAAAVLGGLGSAGAGQVANTADAPGPSVVGVAGGDPTSPVDGSVRAGSGTAAGTGSGTAAAPGTGQDTGVTTSPTDLASCPPAAPLVPGPTADPALVAAGTELRRNRNITLCEAGAAALDAGAVDGRLLAILALLADGHTFRVDEITGGAATLAVLESVLGSDAPAADAAIWLRAQRGPYAPTTVQVVGRGGLYIGYGEIPDA